MHIDRENLRERMRSRSLVELRVIVDNERAEYTNPAVNAARAELDSRESKEALEGVVDSDRDSRPAAYEALRTILPAGLWYAFCVANFVVVVGGLVMLLEVAFLLADRESLAEVARRLFLLAALPTFALWVAAAIRAERAYVRVLLALTGSAAVYKVVEVFVIWQLDQDDIFTIGILVAAFWYFAFNDRMNRYYRARASANE